MMSGRSSTNNIEHLYCFIASKASALIAVENQQTEEAVELIDED